MSNTSWWNKLVDYDSSIYEVSRREEGDTVGVKKKDDEDEFAKFSEVTGWRTVLMLQFQGQWTRSIVFAMYISYISVVLGAAWSCSTEAKNIPRSLNDVVSGIIYCFDIFYAIDVSFMIVYKTLDWSDMKFKLPERHGAIILLECLSMIPLELIYFITTEANMKVFHCLRLRYTLRMMRLSVYYKKKRIQLHVVHHKQFIMMHMGILMLLVVTFGSISYVIKCKGQCSYTTNALIKLGASLYLAGAIFTTRGVTAAVDEDPLVMNAFITLFVLSLNTFFLALFIDEILHMVGPKSTHINTYNRIVLRVGRWEKSDWHRLHAKYLAAVKEYAQVVWVHGIANDTLQTHLHEVMPEIMYKEILCDISLNPLKHSHLFRNRSTSYLSSLGAAMTHKFLMPGEVIFKRGEHKSAMTYIISGTVDVLAEEDGESVLFSLTSGTCLGESTLIVDYPSVCSVIARDVCEVASLRRRNFYNVSKFYEEQFRMVKNDVMTRFEVSHSCVAITKFNIASEEIDEKLCILKMKLFKNTLRQLLYDVDKHEDVYCRQPLKKVMNLFFYPKFLDMYVLAEETKLVFDSVFVRKTFPYILKPDTLLLRIWEGFVLILINVLMLSYPYFEVYSTSDWYSHFFIFVTLVWVVDFYLKSSTAIRTKYYTYETLPTIMMHNITRLSFFVDFVAMVPFDYFVVYQRKMVAKYIYVFYTFNRLLKIYRLGVFFERILTTTAKHVMLQYVKNMLYGFYRLYYCGTILFLLAEGRTEYHMHEVGVICMSIYGYLQIYIDSSVTLFPYLTNFNSYLVLMCLQVLSFVMHIYFISYTCAAEKVALQYRHDLIKFEQNLETTMNCFAVEIGLRQRIRKYIQLQTEYYGPSFMDETVQMQKLPRYLYVMACDLEIGHYVKSISLFEDINEAMIAQICTVAEICLLPENEKIVEIGQVCSTLYIVINGHCLMTSVNGEEKELITGDEFSVLENCLNLASLNEVVTLTACKLIAIKYADLKTITLQCMTSHDTLKSTIDYFADWNEIFFLKKSHKKAIAEDKSIRKAYNFKTFGYFMKRRTVRYYEYHDVFPKHATILKYVLLRYIFHCNGKFIFYWEISRCIFATITCTIIPFSTLGYEDLNSFYGLLFFLDLTGFVDIYIRHHVSYYNDKGIEIVHPYKTALHYWRHSFLVDFIGCCPFTLILIMCKVEIHFWHSITKLLQLYRLQGLRRQLFRKRVVSSGVCFILTQIPTTAILYNYVAAGYFVQACHIDDHGFSCLKDSWLASVNATSPLQTYVFAVLFGLAGFANSSLSLISVTDDTEMLFYGVLCLVGYVHYAYMSANTFSTNLSVNYDISLYARALDGLKSFLALKHFDARVKHEAVNHFEYVWNTTKGKSLQDSFAPFCSTFKKDVLHHIYGVSFTKSTIFSGDNRLFFKDLLVDVKHEFYLKRGILHKVNDVSDVIYLLLRGLVEVVGADGNRLVTLHPGSIFGHIDDCSVGRRTLTMVASTHVEVLTFPSSVFYRHLKRYPNLHARFRRLTALHVDYLEETRKIETKISSESISSKENTCCRVIIRTKIITIFEHEFIGAVSIFTYLADMYSVTTQDQPTTLMIALYFCDFLYIVKIYLKFRTSIDDYGTVITEWRSRKRNYMRSIFGFYFDLFCVIPFEFASFLVRSERRWVIWSVGRLNRLLRALVVLISSRNVQQKLNSQLFLRQLIYLFTWFILLMYTLACFLHYQLYKINTTARYKFVRSLHMVLNMVAKLNVVAYKIDYFNYKAALALIILITAARLINKVFIAEVCALIKIKRRSRNDFSNHMIFVRSYLKLENVSRPLKKRIMEYMQYHWIYNDGVQHPKLLDDAPYYLREAIMNCMFGYHIRKHPVLKHCHVDMIRQMAAEFHVLTFFPGSIIAYAGESAQTMYFIEHGQVKVLSEDTMCSEVVERTLNTGDMFGFHQGMHRSYHEYSYKVTKHTVVVCLSLDDWIRLLQFFPASDVMIYKQRD